LFFSHERLSIWVYFFHDNGLSWVSCNYWKCFCFSLSYSSFEWKSRDFYKATPFWFFSSSLILTLCRCGMAICLFCTIRLGALGYMAYLSCRLLTSNNCRDVLYSFCDTYRGRVYKLPTCVRGFLPGIRHSCLGGRSVLWPKSTSLDLFGQKPAYFCFSSLAQRWFSVSLAFNRIPFLEPQPIV
jgi:hypothetical protein